MSRAPQFILITGPNASGKTTLIEANRPRLQEAGFSIIIPDNIIRELQLKYQTSNVNHGPVILDAVIEPINKRGNLVVETPFNSDGFQNTLTRIKSCGYIMTMYQIMLPEVTHSIRRVNMRYKTGGLYIDQDQVEENFRLNTENVSGAIPLFNKCYILNTADQKFPRLLAEFRDGKLIGVGKNIVSKKTILGGQLKKMGITAATVRKISENRIITGDPGHGDQDFQLEI